MRNSGTSFWKRERKRRTKKIGAFPSDDSAMRLAGSSYRRIKKKLQREEIMEAVNNLRNKLSSSKNEMI